ncbi:hypothetical protein BD779DRAFT_1583302 [Infundibulicybe gibba]|nr:hypothetical protein BD779DRAFT_1583302 [Infundibulicybe gibba]
MLPFSLLTMMLSTHIVLDTQIITYSHFLPLTQNLDFLYLFINFLIKSSSRK